MVAVIDDKFLQTDKAVSQRISKVFTDPKQHKFVSEYDFDEWHDVRGPKGGKYRGRKTICHYCGHKARDHQIDLP